MRRALLGAACVAAALLGGAATAAGPRFKLTLAEPMRAGSVRLDPGTYDVTFEETPHGSGRFIAVFSRGGGKVATAPAELRNAPANLKLTEVPDEWIRASLENAYARRDGSVHPVKFEFRARTQRVFFEALLTEFVPTPTPTPKKK